MNIDRIPKIYKAIFVSIMTLLMVCLTQSCTYDEDVSTYEVEVFLSLKEEGISVR